MGVRATALGPQSPRAPGNQADRAESATKAGHRRPGRRLPEQEGFEATKPTSASQRRRDAATSVIPPPPGARRQTARPLFVAWKDLVAAHFPLYKGVELQEAAHVLALLNGRSARHEPPPPQPWIPTEQGLLFGSRHLDLRANAERLVVDPTRLGRWGGSLDAPRAVPRPNSAYAPQAGDTLRGVLLAAFPEAFARLGAEEAARKLEGVMAAHALVLGIDPRQLDRYEAIWIPPWHVLEGTADNLEQGDEPGEPGIASELGDEVAGAGRHARRDALVGLAARRAGGVQGAGRVSVRRGYTLARRAMMGAVRQELLKQDLRGGAGLMALPTAMMRELSRSSGAPAPDLDAPKPGETAKAFVERVYGHLRGGRKRRLIRAVAEFQAAVAELTAKGVLVEKAGAIEPGKTDLNLRTILGQVRLSEGRLGGKILRRKSLQVLCQIFALDGGGGSAQRYAVGALLQQFLGRLVAVSQERRNSEEALALLEDLCGESTAWIPTASGPSVPVSRESPVEQEDRWLRAKGRRSKRNEDAETLRRHKKVAERQAAQDLRAVENARDLKRLEER